MSVKGIAIPKESEIQRTRNAIRRSWSPEERQQRWRLAETKQQRLFSLLLAQPAPIPARVA